MRGHQPRRRGPPGADPGRRDGPAAGRPAAGRAPVRGHPPAHPPALGPCSRAAVLPGRRPRRRPGDTAAPGPGIRGERGRDAGPRHVTAALPDRPGGAARRLGVRDPAPRPAQGGGLHDRGARDPAQGRPDLRLPGQRRALGADLHPGPLPHRGRPGPDGLGEYHTAALDLAAGTDVLVHDAFLVAAEVPAEAAFGHAAAEYAAGLGQRAGARRVALAHHKPDRTDDELDELDRLLASSGTGEPGVPEIFVAAEGGILDL